VWSCGFIDIGCLPAAAYRTPIINRPLSERKSSLKQLLRQSGPRDVPYSVLPALARFSTTGGVRLLPSSDSEAPRELVQVSPHDLAASFGPGVQLKRVTLELTDNCDVGAADMAAMAREVS
jgi:hypothetical protein